MIDDGESTIQKNIVESIQTITAILARSQTITDSQYDKISQLAYRYKGTIYRLSGDSFVILFGYPDNYDNDSQRAIEAAGELRFKFPSLHIGISTDDTFVSPDATMDYTKLKVTIEAQELANIAKAGQIFINPQLYSLIADNFKCTPHQTPAPCYEIIGVSERLRQKIKPSSSQQRTKKSQRSKAKGKGKSKAIFKKRFNKWISKSSTYVYYLFAVLALIACILAVLYFSR